MLADHHITLLALICHLVSILYWRGIGQFWKHNEFWYLKVPFLLANTCAITKHNNIKIKKIQRRTSHQLNKHTNKLRVRTVCQYINNNVPHIFWTMTAVVIISLTCDFPDPYHVSFSGAGDGLLGIVLLVVVTEKDTMLLNTEMTQLHSTLGLYGWHSHSINLCATTAGHWPNVCL